MEGGDFREGLAAAASCHSAAGHHLMLAAGQQLQHPHGISFISGLAQNLPAADHDGVGGYHHIGLFPGDGQSLQAADPGYLLLRGQLGVHGFIDIRSPDGEGNAENLQQFLPPGRRGSQNQLHSFVLSKWVYSTPRR